MGAYIIFKTVPFQGYKTGMPEFKGKMVVAIPEKKLQEAEASSKQLCVYNKEDSSGGYMIFDGDEIPTSFGEFKDKFGREEMYKLYYYEWKPINDRTLFNT